METMLGNLDTLQRSKHFILKFETFCVFSTWVCATSFNNNNKKIIPNIIITYYFHYMAVFLLTICKQNPACSDVISRVPD